LPILPLHQELYLVAHDNKGNPLIHLPLLSLGLAGAVLLDLMLTERIVVHGGLPAVHISQPVGEPVSDTIIQAILRAPEPRTLVYWIPTVSKDIYDRVSGGLVAGGLLSRTSRRRMGVRTDVLAPTEPGKRARIQSDVQHAVNGRWATEPASGVLCGLIGVLRLERTLGIEGQTADVLRRLRELSDTHYPESGPVFDLILDLLGESATAAFR
jgi:Golgi phosphoprotein 3 (GPP34)